MREFNRQDAKDAKRFFQILRNQFPGLPDRPAVSDFRALNLTGERL
jgi:hypothetical protein